MLYNRVPLVPNKLWEWSTVNIGTDSFSCDENVLKFALMKKANASVTERGVKFKNMYFTNPELEADCWFSKARENGRKRLKLSLTIEILIQFISSMTILKLQPYIKQKHQQEYLVTNHIRKYCTWKIIGKQS